MTDTAYLPTILRGIAELAHDNPTWPDFFRQCADELDRLTLDCAWLRNIADGRGEENEELRRRLAAERGLADRLAEALLSEGYSITCVELAAWKAARP